MATADSPNTPPPLLSSLGSRVIDFAQLAVQPTRTGLRRGLFEGATATLTRFEGHITTLNPGEAPHPPHHHPDEELILIKDGTLEVVLNGKSTQAGPGSVLFFASGDEHGVRNAGANPATYHVFRFSTPLTADPELGRL